MRYKKRAKHRLIFPMELRLRFKRKLFLALVQCVWVQDESTAFPEGDSERYFDLRWAVGTGQRSWSPASCLNADTAIREGKATCCGLY